MTIATITKATMTKATKHRPTRCSPYTAVTLSLGTGKECKQVNKPLNLSHLSNEHLSGLLDSVHAEWRNRNLSDLHEGAAREEVCSVSGYVHPQYRQGSPFDIGLEQ